MTHSFPPFGVCASLDHAAELADAGWDFIEASAQGLLEGLLPDDQWTGADRAGKSPLPVRACNQLVPAGLKITGREVDGHVLRRYLETVTQRASRLGIQTLVFGSAGARQIPDGWDRSAAWTQLVDFGIWAGESAERHGLRIVIEPLHRGESNVLNRVGEVMELVREVHRPRLGCLVDSHHFWVENDDLAAVRLAGGALRHVHLADRAGRVAPGLSRTSDYRPLFHTLKAMGYDGALSVECAWLAAGDSAAVLGYLRREWAAA